MAIRVALAGRWPKEAAEAVLHASGATFYPILQAGRAELAAALDADDGIIIGAGEKLDADLLSGARACRVISRYGVGVDNVDIAAATRHGIAVTCVPDASVEEVSDHALALILACGRKLFPLHAAIRGGDWGRAGAGALAPARSGLRRLNQLAVGFVGFGRIAQALWRKLRGIGCAGLAYDPWLPLQASEDVGIRRVDDLSTLLRTADIITLHLPLTPETQGMIGAAQIEAMRPGTIVVNTARGGLIDEQALIAGLQSGHLGGAGVDVTAVEPIPPDSTLLHAPNLILTGHSAYYSAESSAELGRRAAESVLAILQGRPCDTVINPNYRTHRGESATAGG